MYELRPYQLAAKDAVLHEWDVEGHRKTLLVLPTGAGKTIVFAAIAEDRVKRGNRVLILAHREELLEQAQDKLQKATNLKTVLEKAEHRSFGSNIPVTVGSMQTLAKANRLEKFPEDYFQVVIVDEAHHSANSSYTRILNHFPGAYVLGVTATPDRGDQKDLGGIFDSTAYTYSLQEAVRDEYLCPVKAGMIPLKINLSGVKNDMTGDYDRTDLGAALEEYLDEIAQKMLAYCQNRKTVVFLPLIATSQKFCAILNSYGFRAAEVNCNSPDRKEILSDFESGKYNVLCNAMLLTEGWDCPAVDCIVVLRPTKIRSLYQQMVGRGMRPSPGKENLLLLDFLWLTTKHSLCTPASLVSKTDEIADRIEAKILEGEINLLEVEAEVEDEILEEKRQQALDEQKKREDALSKQLADKSKRKQTWVNPLDVQTYIYAGEWLNYDGPTYAWEKEHSTQKQQDALAPYGIDASRMTKGEACVCHNVVYKRAEMGLANPMQVEALRRKGISNPDSWTYEAANKELGWGPTPKQVNKLMEFGFTDAAKWSRKKASKCLDALHRNGWNMTPQIWSEFYGR